MQHQLRPFKKIEEKNPCCDSKEYKNEDLLATVNLQDVLGKIDSNAM